MTHAVAHASSLAAATEEQLKLLEMQRQLERDPHGAPPTAAARFRFIDAPLNEAMYTCVTYGQSAAAEKLRAEFRVPDRRWWVLKLKGLARGCDWSMLRELRSAPRSPVGFKDAERALLEQLLTWRGFPAWS